MRMRQRAHKGFQGILASLLGCLCLVGWLSAAEATSVIRLSEAQMVEMSTLIVRGKVASQRYIKGPNGMGVVTLVTIQVLEEVLGRKAPKQVIVRHFGGKIGKQVIKMIGGPSFANGNEVLVFLQVSKYLPKGEYLLVGLTQGKWIVQRGDKPAGTAPSKTAPNQSTEPVVVRSLQGLKLYKSNGKPMQLHNHKGHNHKGHNHQALSSRQTLSALVKRLRGHWQKIKKNGGKKPVLLLPKVSPSKKKVVLPKSKIQTMKNLKLVKPKVRTPVRRAVPKQQK